MYSSAIRSPTTRTVLPLNRSTAALRRWGSNISGYPGQNPVHCVQEVLRHVVGLARPQRPAVLPLAEAVARQHQNRPRSRSLARDDVDDLIAHGPRAGEVQPEVGRGAADRKSTRLN